jgi:hypothetical protein
MWEYTNGENAFRINWLCLWCARRAHSFVAISMGCKDPLRHKVHFEPKSIFEEVTV